MFAKIKDTGADVVLKCYNRFDQLGKDFYSEIMLLPHLNAFPDTKTAHCYGMFYTDDRVGLVLEKLDTDLHFFLSERALSEEQMMAIFYKVLHAFNAIHGLGVIHNDIKPQNIMVVKTNTEGAYKAEYDDEYDIRIIDFGLSEFFGIGQANVLSTNYTATEEFKAPDDMWTTAVYPTRTGVVQSDRKYVDGNRKSYGSDVYSIAVTMLSMWMQSYAEVQSYDGQIHWNGVRVDVDDVRFPPKVLHLLLRMLDPIARRRITCAEALAHPYFTTYQQKPLHIRLGGMTKLQRANLIHRYDTYTRAEYEGRQYELAFIEKIHLHYITDVIPCFSKQDGLARATELFEWLVTALHTEIPQKRDYWITKNKKFMFETLDVIINGAALAARSQRTNRQMIGLASCHIYASIFESYPTTAYDLATMLPSSEKRTFERSDAKQILDQCIHLIVISDSNFPIKPIWLHVTYLHLKLSYEPHYGAYKDTIGADELDHLLEASVAPILFYYSFVIKPVCDFTTWEVVQYSVMLALSTLIEVEIVTLARNPPIPELHMDHFDQVHSHYELQRLALQALVQ